MRILEMKKNMIGKKLNKATMSALTVAVLSIGTMFTSTPAESAPCSCWDAGTIACHNSNIGGCSRCWAAFDTGAFSPTFSLDEVSKVKAEIDKLFGGVMSEENWDKAKDAVGKATGVPIKAIWDPAFYAGAFVGAGVDAMENCKKACHSAKALHKIKVPYGTDQVWWYADATALESCKNYQKWYNSHSVGNRPPTIDIVNKYQYSLR